MGVYYGMNGLWVPVGGQGGAAPIDPNLLAENIKSGVTISGVTGTFTNDGTATASDMAKGVTAYVNGQKITGNVTTAEAGIIYGGWSATAETAYVGDDPAGIVIKSPLYQNILFRSNSILQAPVDKSNFGNATASDVASGKTFTSSAGLKVTGTNALNCTIKKFYKSAFNISKSNNYTIVKISVDGLPSTATILGFWAYIKYNNTGLGYYVFGDFSNDMSNTRWTDTNANYICREFSMANTTNKITLTCVDSLLYDDLVETGLLSPSSWKDGGGFVVFQ